jgi:hypothetical protein
MTGWHSKFFSQDSNLLLKPFNTTALLTIVNKDAVKNKKPKFSINIGLQPIELGAFCFRVCMLWRFCAWSFASHAGCEWNPHRRLSPQTSMQALTHRPTHLRARTHTHSHTLSHTHERTHAHTHTHTVITKDVVCNATSLLNSLVSDQMIWSIVMKYEFMFDLEVDFITTIKRTIFFGAHFISFRRLFFTSAVI